MNSHGIDNLYQYFFKEIVGLAMRHSTNQGKAKIREIEIKKIALWFLRVIKRRINYA